MNSNFKTERYQYQFLKFSNDFPFECFKKRATLSIKDLMEEFLVVVCEELEFENRDESKLTGFFLQFLDNQELDTLIKTNGFESDWSLQVSS